MRALTFAFALLVPALVAWKIAEDPAITDLRVEVGSLKKRVGALETTITTDFGSSQWVRDLEKRLLREVEARLELATKDLEAKAVRREIDRPAPVQPRAPRVEQPVERRKPEQSRPSMEESEIAMEKAVGCLLQIDAEQFFFLAINGDRDGMAIKAALGVQAGQISVFWQGEIVYVLERKLFTYEGHGFELVKVRRKGENKEYWLGARAVRARG